MFGRVAGFVVLLVSAAFAGCLGTNLPKVDTAPIDPAPVLDYIPAEPDLTLVLEQLDGIVRSGNVEIHARVVKPEGPGPFPVIAQFTPYSAGPGAPGQSAMANNLVEPAADCVATPGPPGGLPVSPPAWVSFSAGCEGGFDRQFVRRGYAFAYADVRGTGDSTGCLDLRGKMDIADAYALTEWLGTQPWSNGKVAFIGASYPGSEAHIAAIANNPHLAAVVPVVASTSFYHYHHNDGVPYNGNHALGGTNAGYSQNALAPTSNVQLGNWGTRWIDEAQCPTAANIAEHGGLDQSGAYYQWWMDRNLRGRAAEVKVPVLMGQGLADWNVKPDHIATWFNDLQVSSKTLIAGQWGHAYPYSKCAEGQNPASCDDRAPYGKWYDYVVAFFDTFLKGVDTKMFQGSTAWIQDSMGTFHRSAHFPLLPEEREEMVLYLSHHRNLNAVSADYEDDTAWWYGCADDQYNRGQSNLATVESTIAPCVPAGRESISFTSQPMAQDMIISGVPLVDLTLTSERSFTHLVAVLEILGADDKPVEREIREGVKLTTRENYGYLNPTYREGIDAPRPIPTGTPYPVTIDLYPQEDVVKAGERIRLTLSSDDGGRTIESYTSGKNTLLVGPGSNSKITLPLRPAALQGIRLA